MTDIPVIASFSGGKDSTAMVVRMIEIGDRLDEVVYCDTGMEFPAMYDHIAKVKEHVEANGVKFVTLEPDFPFEWGLYQKPVQSRTLGEIQGYGWPMIHFRWCTKHLKNRPLERHVKSLGGKVIQCVGLAADEEKRLAKPNNQGNRHPLAEWGWTEDMALGYCYGKGFDWYDPSVGKGLYEIFNRTSCWICPLSNLDKLRKLRRYYPGLWARIGELEELTCQAHGGRERVRETGALRGGVV